MAETRAHPCRALELLRADILSGIFGAPGERFMTTRELAEVRRVSPVTAQHMLCALREERLVALRGKRYYLSHGLVGADTPLGRQSARGRLIGLHVTTIDTPFFSALTHAAQKSADALDCRLLTAESGYDSAREREILNAFKDIGAAGILTCPGLSEDCLVLYERYCLPHVFLGRKPPGVTGEAGGAGAQCTWRGARGRAFYPRTAQIKSGCACGAAYHLEPALIVRGSTSAAPAVCFRELHARDMLYRLGE